MSPEFYIIAASYVAFFLYGIFLLRKLEAGLAEINEQKRCRYRLAEKINHEMRARILELDEINDILDDYETPEAYHKMQTITNSRLGRLEERLEDIQDQVNAEDERAQKWRVHYGSRIENLDQQVEGYRCDNGKFIYELRQEVDAYLAGPAKTKRAKAKARRKAPVKRKAPAKRAK